MLKWIFGRKLESALEETRTVRISGVRFKIKKVSALDYMDGAKVLRQMYDTYKVTNDQSKIEINDKKVKEHFSHVLVAGVKEPRLTLKEDGEGIHVDKLFVDWKMVNELYEAIMLFTYGKKKMSAT